MDNNVLSIFELSAIFIPLILAIYLLYCRLNLSIVNKKVLNYGCIFVNLFSFITFLGSYFLKNNNEILNCSFNFFASERFHLNLGLIINETNISFLIVSSFLLLLFSIYLNLYFRKKKQFIFTKQRFYIFVAFMSSLMYLFLASINLFQASMILILQSIGIVVFSFFDLFKNPTNYNTTRFHRISLIGNIALLCAVLILFKYAMLSQGYVSSISLDYSELNILTSYIYGISSSIEFLAIIGCLILVCMTRLTIFPFSCYYSFFANSSSVFYILTLCCINNIVGLFLLIKFIPLLEFFDRGIIYLKIFLILGIIFSLFQILFEKNIKIIFGYLASIFNSIFIILCLIFNINILKNYYFIFNIILLIILMSLFYKDKNNFKKRLINRQNGFLLEKLHITFFETIEENLIKILEIIDDKIIQNILKPFFKFIEFLSLTLNLKNKKNNSIKNIRNILIIFILTILIAIFIALFGGLEC